MQQGYEGVGDGRSVVAGIQLLSKSVEGEGILAKVANIEDGFGVGKIEALEVCVEACLWRAKVWYACRGADAGTGLCMRSVLCGDWVHAIGLP